MSNKRYYWLKLKEDFFGDKAIKKLRKIAGGDTYTIIYLKLLLRSMKTDGKLYYDGVEETFSDELALDIDEDKDNVKMTVMYLIKSGLLKEVNEQEIEMTRLNEMVGSETEKAELMRRKRARDKLLDENNEVKALPPKTNAERQKSFRAKQYCEQQPHIPLIEDYYNKKRYGGNYYNVFKRDRGECVICGSNDTICVHHIDGYDEFKPENNSENKMITLCRSCHIRVHRSDLEIPKAMLENIGYFSNVTKTVTFCYTEKEKEKKLYLESELDLDLEEERNAKKYGKYKNVILTDDEYNKLKDEFPKDYEQRIEKLSMYIKSKGVNYENHLTTIELWASKEQKEDTSSSYEDSGWYAPKTDEDFELLMKSFDEEKSQ